MSSETTGLGHLTVEQLAEYAKLPEPFQFYRLMLSGDHPHFGYWLQNDLNLSLEAAQENLFDRLIQEFPKPPASILDVGCGLGFSAHLLGRQGFDVTAIVPSLELIDYAINRYETESVRFEAAGFLDDGNSQFISRKYDVIFFQESLQYLHPLDLVFGKARRLLNPKGKLILCDEVIYDSEISQHTLVHFHKSILQKLAENGFRLLVHDGIGNRVQQTCDHMLEKFDQYRNMLIQLVHHPDTADRIDHYLTGWKAQKAWYEAGQMGYELITARKDDVMIRTYREGDEDRILALFTQLFGTNRSLSHWYWKFRDNPFGSYKIAIADSTDGILAANFCGYPVPVYSMGKVGSFLSYQGGDTMTNPAFRGAGLGKNSVLARITNYFYDAFCENEIPFIYGFNTGIIRKFGERFLNYEYIAGIPYHVLEHTGEKNVPNAKRLLWYLSGFRVDKIDRITDEYDLFFKRVCRDYGILVERNATYLKWRYLDCPDRVHEFFAIRKWGKLVGWGVFRRKDHVLLWGDALFDATCPQAAQVFLSEVIRRTAANRIEGWFSPRPAWWTRVLKQMGFVVTEEPNKLAPCFKRFSRDFDTMMFENQFYYTMGDSDLF
jgi:SAM-dependent methyltransferase